MKKHLVVVVVVVVGLAVSLTGGIANAHVTYLNLDAAPVLVNTQWSGTAIVDSCTGKSTGCQSSNAFTRFGWLKGTEATLGDSHFLTVNANFWQFTLLTTSSVTITFAASGTSASSLDPAFSVYSGLLPTASHDDTSVDPLNPSSGGCAAISPKDAHAAPWTYQVHDGFRDTQFYATTGGLSACQAVSPYVGQFDAFAGWSMANANGTWSSVTYVASVSATAFNGHAGGTHTAGGHGTSETLTITNLPAGSYTIAAGGESCTVAPPYGGACGSPRLYGTISYTHSP